MNRTYLILIAASLLAATVVFNACGPSDDTGPLTVTCDPSLENGGCDYADYCAETDVLDDSGFPTGETKYECAPRDTCSYEMQDCPIGWYCETTGYCFKGDAPIPDNNPSDSDTALPDTAQPDNNQPDNGTDSVMPDNVQTDNDTAQTDTDTNTDTDTTQPDTVVPDTDTGGVLDFTEDFESGAGNWTLEGDWQIGAPGYGVSSPHGGANCAGTNLTGVYSNDADFKMILNQQLAIPGGAAEPVIEFYAYVNAEGSSMIANDYAEVLVKKSTDTWDSATKAVFTVGPYLDSSKTKLTGNVDNSDTVWRLYSASLSAVKGETVQLAFRFRSDSSSAAAGVYIDDIHIH